MQVDDNSSGGAYNSEHQAEGECADRGHMEAYESTQSIEIENQVDVDAQDNDNDTNNNTPIPTPRPSQFPLQIIEVNIQIIDHFELFINYI